MKKNEWVNDDFFTTEEASKKLNITERTLQDKLRAGDIKGVKLFGRWYVLKSTILELMYDNLK